MTPFGRGFPVNFVVTVAGDVFAKLLEVTALADLALGMQAEAAAIQEESGEIFALGQEVGIDANLGLQRV